MDLALEESPSVPWVWSGYLARGQSTLLTGLWKAGKTTLVAHLLRSLGPGGTSFVDRDVVPGHVIVVSEESRAQWAHRQRRLSIGAHVSIIARPFLGVPTRATWNQFCEYAARQVRAYGTSLVVLDAIANLWPVSDENDAAQVTAALAPLRRILEVGAAVLLVHHPKKDDATEGRASRGSGALTAWVDTIVELRRVDAEHGGTRRALVAFGRSDETPSELVLDYDVAGGCYRSLGTRRETTREDRWSTVLSLFDDLATSLTVDELKSRWPNDAPCARPGKSTLDEDLKDWCEQGRLHRTGQGVKRDPFRYTRESSPDDDANSFLPTSGSKGAELGETAVGGVEEVRL